MNKSNKLCMILLIISTIIIAGCVPDISLPWGEGKGTAGRGVVLYWVDYPSQTDPLDEFEQFVVSVGLENNLLSPITGTLCIRDSLGDIFGGIPAEDCTPLVLDVAQQIDNRITPTKTPPIGFGPYAYKNLDPELSKYTTITVYFKYPTTTRAHRQICIKRPYVPETAIPSNIDCKDTQTFTNLEQPTAPLQVTQVKKRVAKLSENEIQLKLDIYLSKTTEGFLFSPEAVSAQRSIYAEPEIEFNAYLGEYPMLCPRAATGRIPMEENEKVIKCHLSINLASDYEEKPLVITLGYGFQQEIHTPRITLRKEEAYIV